MLQLGRAASIIELEVSSAIHGAAIPSNLTEAAKKLAMHIVAAKPSYLSLQDIPADLMAKETAIFREQSAATTPAAGAGGKAKSPEIMEKMIMGKVNKRLGEIVLLEQTHVAEEGAPVISKHLDALGKMLGAGSKVRIKRFYHWTLGQDLQ
jgi:elongation factor Ts